MAFTPYDWNLSIQHRVDYIEERLRDGSPVVGIGTREGVLLVTIHRTRRKVFEIYDRLLFGGVGNQSDLETIRSAAIDFAHREGFQRSPDDVTVQRLVGSALSPALKRAFADPFGVPFVFRGLFGELGDRPEDDLFYVLGYDGEFRGETGFSAVAGSLEAENRMLALLHERRDPAMDRESALRLALEAWAAGRMAARSSGDEADDPGLPGLLREELAAGTLEAGLLERDTPRERTFRLLDRGELEAAASAFR